MLAILLPVRVIAEANRDWRLLSWVLALIVVGYSLTFLWRLGGRPWLTHFAFPVCFPLIAVPWLVQPENIIVQTLARAVAAVAVEIAGWIGIGAYQRGNVIELPNGFVGVDDACSGVKTLQAAIMVTLFLGELQRLTPRQRVFLVVAGSAWVFLCNILRATTLVILAARRGTAAIAEWHDLIGTIVLIAGMAGLMALGWWLGRGSTFVAGDQTPSGGLPEIPRRSVALEAGIALGWLAAVFGASELWYRAHERSLVQQPAWKAEWPAKEKSLQRPPIPESTQAILRYDEASMATWESSRWDGVVGLFRPVEAWACGAAAGAQSFSAKSVCPRPGARLNASSRPSTSTRRTLLSVFAPTNLRKTTGRFLFLLQFRMTGCLRGRARNRCRGTAAADCLRLGRAGAILANACLKSRLSVSTTIFAPAKRC